MRDNVFCIGNCWFIYVLWFKLVISLSCFQIKVVLVTYHTLTCNILFKFYNLSYICDQMLILPCVLYFIFVLLSILSIKKYIYFTSIVSCRWLFEHNYYTYDIFDLLKSKYGKSRLGISRGTKTYKDTLYSIICPSYYNNHTNQTYKTPRF